MHVCLYTVWANLKYNKIYQTKTNFPKTFSTNIHASMVGKCTYSYICVLIYERSDTSHLTDQSISSPWNAFQDKEKLLNESIFMIYKKACKNNFTYHVIKSNFVAHFGHVFFVWDSSVERI